MATKSLTFDIYGRDKTASKTIRKVGNEIDDTGGRFKRFGAIAAAGLAAAAVGAIKFGADSVQAYADAEESQNRLEDAFKRFPRLADTNIEALRDLNTELMKKTRFDDDALAVGQSVLAQYELTGQQLKDITPLLADYAAKTGKDLPTAAKDLGKALLGNGRALKDIGIDFTDTGSVAGNFDQLMQGLRGQVQGFAESDASTASGQLEILRNRFGEVQEKVGEELMPILQGFTDWLETDGMVVIEDFAAGVSDLFAGVQKVSEQPWYQDAMVSLGEGGSLDLVGGGFVDRFKTKWAELPASFANGWEQIKQGNATASDAIGQAFEASWNDWAAKFANGREQINTGVTQWLEGLVASFANGWDQIAGAFANGWEQIKALASVIGATIATFASTSVATLTAPWANGWAQISGAFSNGWSQIQGITAGVVGTIGSFVGAALGTLGQLPGRIMGMFASAGSWLFSAGQNIVMGLVRGIQSAIGAAIDAAARLARVAADAARSVLRIKSPSRVFQEIGGYVGEGYVQGIKKSMSSVSGAVEAMVAPPPMRTAYAPAGVGGVVEEHIHVHVEGKEVASAIRRYERSLR